MRAKGAIPVQMIHVVEKTDKDGTLLLRIPLGMPEAEGAALASQEFWQR